MCGPFAAAALAASAAMSIGSTLASRSADNAVQSAQSGAIAREAQRQKLLQAQAAGTFQKSLDRSQKPNQDQLQNEALTQRAQAYSNSTSAPPSYQPGTEGAPDVVKGEADRAIARADASTAQQAGAKAQLDSFGDVDQGNAISAGRNMDILKMLGNFSQGSQAVLPYELQAAQQRGAGKRTLADMLRAGSSIAGAAAGGLGGAGSWFAPAAAGVIGSNAAARGF